MADVTAIVNAANSQLLGCFQPDHRCIDNVIHSAAGPQLREEYNIIMEAQGYLEPVGSAKVTPGFLLPVPWVLHTVGPQLSPREAPQEQDKAQLDACYRSCLYAAEALPQLPNGRKVVAFCCISTGLFAFPSDVAAQVATNAVMSWCTEHPITTITDIIFDTYLDKDWDVYHAIPSRLRATTLSTPSIPASPTPTPALTKARIWLDQASHLIIPAGAGLSAATGLDYTSQTLFSKRFPVFRARGLRHLWDVFGHRDWATPAQE